MTFHLVRSWRWLPRTRFTYLHRGLTCVGHVMQVGPIRVMFNYAPPGVM